MTDTTFYGKVKIAYNNDDPAIAEGTPSIYNAIILDGMYGSIGLIDNFGNRVMLLDPHAEDGKYSALFLGEGKAGIMIYEIVQARIL